MIIFPAIDIKDGNCVRLYKGDMNTAETVADSYMQTAKQFKAAGSEYIHMVDLNGAIEGKRINSNIFIDVAKNSGLKVELGGGIRTMDDIEFYLSNGIERIILGSVALKNPALVEEAVKKFGGGTIAVGIDAVDGKVATEGWVEVSGQDYIELAKRMESFGVEYIICTDIKKDGMLSGPNVEQLAKLNEAVSCNITASGGIKDINDIKDLYSAGLYAAICGRSLYSGTLDLEEAIKVGAGNV